MLSALLVVLSVVQVEARLCGTRYLELHQEEFPLPRPKLLAPRRVAEEIEVGSQLDFLVSGDSRLRSATCRYVGDHCFIFVDDTQWDTNGGRIYQSDVDGLGELFEHSTPADPERGIYELEVEAFG